MINALVALGSNVGERAAQIEAALRRLEQAAGIEGVRASTLRETAPAGGPADQPPFINAAAVVRTRLSPEELLALLREVEDAAGRTRAEHWGPRVLDLDLILHGVETRDSEALTLPHPRFSFRRFVLEPAVEIAGEMIFPPTGLPISQLLAWLDHSAPQVVLSGPPELADLARQLTEVWRTSAGRSASADWQCLFSPNPNLLHSPPRLVVAVGDRRQHAAWLTEWRGPRLLLSAACSLADIRREVIAAWAAME